MVSKPTLVIACGAIAHELVAVLKASAWDHVSIQCLPAEWHNTPVHIAPGVEKKIIENKEAFDRILIAYGDCGTGGILDDVIKRHNVQRLPGNHCYDFFAGVERFAALADEELGTFYLTDYLAAHFDRLILDGLGNVASGTAGYVFRPLHSPRLSRPITNVTVDRQSENGCRYTRSAI